MAATMEQHDRTSTIVSETIVNASDSGNINESSPTIGSEAVDDNYDSTTTATESTQNGEKSTNFTIQESAVSSSSSTSHGHTRKNDVDDNNECDVEIDMKKDIAKQREEGFKLPGLPLPGKSLVKKMHVPAVHDDAGGTKSDDFHDDQTKGLKSRTENDESKDKTEQTFESKSGVHFAFPKPKLANITKDTRPLQREDSPSGDPSESVLSSSAAALPVCPEQKQREKSPAEKLSIAPPLPYNEPSWSGIPTEEYYLEVLKGGAIVSKIALSDKAYHVFGRLETCDIPLEHPSLSRHHLVLQYRSTGDSEHDPGFYLYDLGSTHGSWFNKQQMEGRVFYRMKVGHMFKLGGSTRMYILQGPSEDQEAELELSVKELIELRQQQLAELEERKKQKTDEDEEEGMRWEEKEKDAGISWGMDYEDADDADASGDNPFAIMTLEEKEATYIKDPKKALRGYFEREGYDLEYNVEEKESGFSKQFVCKVELPIDDASGRPIFAEAAISGKKKEAVAACALEACRILDAHGVLRQATHESRKRKSKNWKDEDYYDSDEDTFLDRTGEIEKKRLQRMKKAGVIKEKAQTYDSLKSQLSDVEAEIQRAEREISTGSQSNASSVLEDDSLDAFMESIRSGKTVDRTWRAKLKLRVIELKKEQVGLARLVNIARPASMPALQRPSTQTSFAALSKKLPLFGSMKGQSILKTKLKSMMPSPKAVPPPSSGQKTTSKEEQIEDEQEEDEQGDLASPPATRSSSQHTGRELPADESTETSRLRPVSEPTQKDLISLQPNPTGSNQNSPPSSPRNVGPSVPIEIRKQKDQQEHGKGGHTKEPLSSSTRRDTEPRRKPWEEVDETGPSETAKKPRMVKGPLKEREMEEKEEKEDFADWLPPVGQTGDGRTHLNAKFGY